MLAFTRSSSNRVQQLWNSVPKPSSVRRQCFSSDSFAHQASQNRSPSTRPVAIYVHWPYCKSICPYCDFNRYLMPTDESNPERTKQTHKEIQSSMRKALLLELETNLEAYRHNTVPTSPQREPSSSKSSFQPIITSIFFGGGTPSLADVCEADHSLFILGNASFVLTPKAHLLSSSPRL